MSSDPYFGRQEVPSSTWESQSAQTSGVPFFPPAPRRQWREWVVPFLLFLATLLSSTFAGLFYVAGDIRFGTLLLTAALHPAVLLLGLPFSLTLLTILLAHELGHFFACKHYGISCTPPYFIPLPVSIAGTLGAFIRIKSPFQHRRALFDVGVAGPLAGFAAALPALFVGISLSKLIPKEHLQGAISFGEPLLFRWIGKLVLGYSPASQDMLAHPIAMAAWFGLLATCLNLFPIWQLDGGHIAYALFGQKLQRMVSILGVFALILISFLGWPIPSYLFFGLLLLVIGARFRFHHPPTLFDDDAVGPERMVVGIIALLILVVSFTPVPVAIS